MTRFTSDGNGLPEPQDEEERKLLKRWTHKYTEDYETRVREPWEDDTVVESNVENEDGRYTRVAVIHDASGDDGERWIESSVYYSREDKR